MPVEKGTGPSQQAEVALLDDWWVPRQVVAPVQQVKESGESQRRYETLAAG